MSKISTVHIIKSYLSTKGSTDNKGNDLFYERVPVIDRHGQNTGKTKKQKRDVPPGLTKTESRSLKRVMYCAEKLDNAISICGVSIGWGAIVGAIPVIGDLLDILMALWVYKECKQCKLSNTVKNRMLLHILIDFFIGLVPCLGDIGDAMFRANTMNAALLYDQLYKRGEERTQRERAGREVFGAGGRTEGPGFKKKGTQVPTATRTASHPSSAFRSPDITRPQKVAVEYGGRVIAAITGTASSQRV